MLSHLVRTRSPQPATANLTSLPVSPGSPGVSPGSPIELFYEPDYLLPHRRAVWLLMGERPAEAAGFAAHLSHAVPVLRPSRLPCLVYQMGAGAARSESTGAGRRG